MSLKDKLKRPKTKPKREGPVWKGPEEDGVTQSLLSRFLVCRERFRLLVVEGLRPADAFNHRIEYGSMWHVCEEGFASEVATREGAAVDCAFSGLERYARSLCRKYPLSQEQVQHWYNVCRVQFPIYVDYWAKHKDEKHCTPLLQEQSFDVPYKLPSGRVVRLRGKWDGVNLLGRGKSAGIFLQENKTKADLDEGQIARQLQFDLQTMLYLTAFREDVYPSSFSFGGKAGEIQHAELTKFKDGPVPIKGIRYNCVRRPLSGGKGSIRRHKATGKKPAETEAHFYERLAGIIAEDPGYYFMRWKVEVTSADIERFKQQFLTPILEQLCDWWEWVSGPFGSADCWGTSNVRIGPKNVKGSTIAYPGIHWRTPFGFYNILAEGGSSELDEYLANGSELGLERTKTLFPELG